MKVLITGANGFVGNHLARELASSGYSVIGIGGATGSQNVANVEKFLSIDLTNRVATNRIDLSGVHAVIHLAGLAAVGPSFDDPMLYINTNIGIETNLFEAALAQGVKPRFLIISSGALYDPTTSLPLNERSSVTPSSPYAVSKLGQEQMAQYYEKRGFEVVIARPFNHIGPGQNQGFILPDLTQQVVAFERGEAEKILVGNLEAKRDYTDVRDIARAYRLLIENSKSGEVYNICSGTSHSGQEILDSIIRISGTNPKVSEDPAKLRPSDAPDIYGDNRKIHDQTGWKPKISLDKTIGDVIADWRNRK